MEEPIIVEGSVVHHRPDAYRTPPTRGLEPPLGLGPASLSVPPVTPAALPPDPEFDAWRWHEYWIPLDTVIEFKRESYRRALLELERFLQAKPQTRRQRLYGIPHPQMPQSYADPVAPAVK